MKVSNKSKTSEVEISASMMCIDWLRAQAQLNLLEEMKIEYLHWDVVDGRFAPDFTMGSSIIDTFRAVTEISSDYHLMVEEPSTVFENFSFSPNDIVTIHQECCRNLHRDLIRIRRMGPKVGVAINPGTSLDTLDYILEEVDVVIIMTVNPGFKGQQIVKQCIRKISDLRKRIHEMKLNTKISVDGNVSLAHIPDMVMSGADILVGGSSGLFLPDGDLKLSIENMRKSIEIGLERRDY